MTRLFLSMIAAESKLCFYHKLRRFIVVLSALFVNKNNSYAHVNYSPQDQHLKVKLEYIEKHELFLYLRMHISHIYVKAWLNKANILVQHHSTFFEATC